jgi:hypothetical protein
VHVRRAAASGLDGLGGVLDVGGLVVAVFGLLVRGLVGCEELVVLEFGITCGDRDSKWIAHHQILCHAACTEYEARHVAERRLGCLSTRLITSSCSMFVASRHARLPFHRLANPMNLSTKQHTHTHTRWRITISNWWLYRCRDRH